jgi:hypothetical protein
LQAFRRKSSNPCDFQSFDIAKTKAFSPVSAFFAGDEFPDDGQILLRRHRSAKDHLVCMLSAPFLEPALERSGQYRGFG